MAPVGSLHPQPARPRPQARRQPARPGRRDGVNNARDVYTRRNEGVSIWVVKAADIVASSPADKDALFEPSNSKVYRHPTFFPMPEEVKNL
jgi:ring-1,2-phenylacetyl-CoA epoxidase subunit PaaB